MNYTGVFFYFLFVVENEKVVDVKISKVLSYLFHIFIWLTYRVWILFHIWKNERYKTLVKIMDNLSNNGFPDMRVDCR